MSLPPYASPLERAWHVTLWTIAVLVLGFLILPILVIVPLSFSSGSFLSFPLPGLSLRWYHELLGSERWLSSLRNSVAVACASTLLATVLGTLAALGLQRARFPGRSLVLALLISPMVVPLVIVAVGVYFFYAPFGLTGSLLGLTLAHTALASPFVVITVSATLQGFDTNLSAAQAWVAGALRLDGAWFFTDIVGLRVAAEGFAPLRRPLLEVRRTDGTVVAQRSWAPLALVVSTGLEVAFW